MDVSHDDSSLASQNSPSKGDFAVKSNDESGMNMSMCPQKTAAQLEREMEKQKIREEIIASEIRRRRELEDEVRMELLIEKRILGMGNVSGFSNFDHNNNNNNNNSALLRNYGVLGSRYGPNFPEHLVSLGTSDDVFGAKMKLISAGDENSIVGIEGMQQLDEAAIGKWPFDRDPSYVAAQVVEKCNAGFADEVMSEAMSSAGITGMKRKAETPAEACDKETSRPTMSTDSQNKWFCAICGVSTTSEVTLNSHFQGRKHRAKEAMYKANNTNAAIVMTDDALTSVSGGSSEQDNSLVSKKWECSLCQVSANSEDLLRSHMQGKKHKAKEAKLLSGEITANANANKVAGENATETVGTWYCSLCGVSASSESNLTAHLNGKKHKAKAGVRVPQQEGDNANCESPKKDSEVEVMKEEKCSDKMKISEHEPITKDEGTESELERDVADKSSMTKTDADENPILGSTSDLSDAKVSVTERNQQESVLEASKDTEEIVKQSNLRMESVKYWHCKMCNQGTHDEAAMAAHRKSSGHMTLLKSQGGGLITVASIPKNAPES